MIRRMAIIIYNLAKKIAVKTKQTGIPTVLEIVDRNLVTVLLLRFGLTIFMNLKSHLSFGTKNHTRFINNPIILQGFIRSGNRLK